MPEERQLPVVLRPEPDAPHGDRLVQALAAAQHGVVARRQLAAVGVTEGMVKARVGSGHLLRLQRGIYAVGHRRLRREGWWLAAVLAGGEQAVLSHRDAAALHGNRPSNGAAVDVTIAAARPDPPGIRFHRAGRLAPVDVVVRDAIPVTSVGRTLVDLAAVVSVEHLAKALSEAERLGLLDLRALVAARERMRGRRGAGHARLAAALAEHRTLGATLTRSELEARFRELVRAAGLPVSRANAVVEGIEVDALWSRERVVVELDGFAFHHSRRAFQRDREQAARLQSRGYAVLRSTHADVVHRGERVAGELRRLLEPSAAVATMVGRCP